MNRVNGSKGATAGTYLGLGAALLLLGALAGEAPAAESARATTPVARSARQAPRGPAARSKRKLPPTDQDILDQAQAAYIRGERQHAIDLATGVAVKGGELAPSAWRFIGLVACSVRASRMATRALGNLAATDDQEALIKACQVNGLALVNKEFVER